MLLGSLHALPRNSEAEAMPVAVRYVQQDMLAQKRLRVLQIQQIRGFRKARSLVKQDTIACCDKKNLDVSHVQDIAKRLLTDKIEKIRFDF